MILLVILLILLSPWNVFATVRFADGALSSNCTSGNYNKTNHDCTGSDGDAYKTLASAVSATGSCDTLYVRYFGGVYTDRIVLTGKGCSAGNYTLISGYNGEIPNWAPTFTLGQSAIAITNWFYLKDLKELGTNSPVNPTPGDNSIAGNYMVGADNWVIDNVEVTGFRYHAFFVQASNWTIKNSKLHDLISGCVSGNRWYGVYDSSGSNGLLERNEVYNNPGGGYQLYPNPINTIARYNRVYANNTCNSSVEGGILTGGNLSVNTQIYGNVIYLNGYGVSGIVSAPCIKLLNPNTNVRVWNNTCYKNQTNIWVLTGSVNPIIQNNIDVGYVSPRTSCTTCGTVYDHNLTSDPGFNDPTSYDLTLRSFATTAIDQGANVGLAFNGTAPDIGAYETFTATGGTVRGNTADVQLNMNLNTPAVVGTTGWSVNNGRSVTGVSLVGSSIARITFNGGACAGESWTFAYDETTGTATDGALIGNSLNQRLWTISATPLTNNCSGVSYVLTQTDGDIFGAIGSQATVGTVRRPSPSGMIAVRTKIKATVSTPPAAITTKLQCTTGSVSGTYADVPDVANGGNCPNIRYVGTGTIANMDAHTTAITTERLTTNEFPGMIQGAVRRCAVGCETPALPLVQDSETEIVDILFFESAAALNTTYFFQQVLVDGTGLNYALNGRPSTTVSMSGAVGID